MYKVETIGDAYMVSVLIFSKKLKLKVEFKLASVIHLSKSSIL